MYTPAFLRPSPSLLLEYSRLPGLSECMDLGSCTIRAPRILLSGSRVLGSYGRIANLAAVNLCSHATATNGRNCYIARSALTLRNSTPPGMAVVSHPPSACFRWDACPKKKDKPCYSNPSQHSRVAV